MSDITIINNALSSASVNPYVSKNAGKVSADNVSRNEDRSELMKEDVVDITSVKLSSKDESKQEEESSAVDKEKEVSKAVQERNEKLAQERMQALNRQYIGLNFSIDEKTEDTIVKVTDMNTKKLVRQIPSEEFLKLSEKLEKLQDMNISNDEKNSLGRGLIFDEKA
ncbi:MAG: flagellar protein FlaG [Succinivibrio sp.]